MLLIRFVLRCVVHGNKCLIIMDNRSLMWLAAIRGGEGEVQVARERKRGCVKVSEWEKEGDRKGLGDCEGESE